MLILLFLCALVRHLHCVPLAPDGSGIADTFADSHILPRANIIVGTRSTSDIVISCLATIFACTWTAIHPNIPSPADSRWNIFKRRVVMTTYALLAPEFITLWAYRQYLGARRIMEDYNSNISRQANNQHGPRQQWYQKSWFGFKEWLFYAPPFYPARDGEPQEWTITHGFFVQMGGFVLSSNGMPIQTMPFSKAWLEENDNFHGYIFLHGGKPGLSNRIKESILARVIDPPKISEAEIKDRSKGDTISKTVVILQTLWFISQCIARWSSRIAVTELEIVTLGFAMLNGITYALWWNKPQNVGVPVYLEAKAQSSTNSHDNHQINDSIPPVPSNPETKLGIEPASRNQIKKESERLVPKKLHDAKLYKPSFLPRKLKDDWGSSTYIQSMFLIPYRLISGVLHPLDKISGGVETSDYVRREDLRVSMFFAEPLRDFGDVYYFVGAVATLFGVVHLVPSFFLHYPSPTEMLLWRISAVFITIQPLFTVLFLLCRDNSLLPEWIRTIIIVLTALSLPLYIVARLTLIILSFLSLRDLPENAHHTIDWISSIPHL